MTKLLFSYIKKYNRNILLIYFCSILFPVTTAYFSHAALDLSLIFFLLWACLMLSFIEINLAFEEKHSVIHFITSLPLKRKDIVQAKYILIFSISVTSLIVYFLFSYLFGISGILIRYNLNIAAVFYTMMTLFCVFFFPLFFKLGYDKAHSRMLLSILILFVTLCITYGYLNTQHSDLLNGIELRLLKGETNLSLLVITISSFLYFVSYMAARYNFVRRDL